MFAGEAHEWKAMDAPSVQTMGLGGRERGHINGCEWGR